MAHHSHSVPVCVFARPRFSESGSRNPMSSCSFTEMRLTPLGESLPLASHVLNSRLTCYLYKWTMYSDVYQNTIALMLVHASRHRNTHHTSYSCCTVVARQYCSYLFCFKGSNIKIPMCVFLYIRLHYDEHRHSKLFLTKIFIRQVGEVNPTEGSRHTLVADRLSRDVVLLFSALLSVCFLSMF